MKLFRYQIFSFAYISIAKIASPEYFTHKNSKFSGAAPLNPCRSSLGCASRPLAHIPVKTMARFALLESKLKSGSEEIQKFLSMGKEGPPAGSKQALKLSSEALELWPSKQGERFTTANWFPGTTSDIIKKIRDA